MGARVMVFGVTAITFNRVGKEDTLMVFFMLFAFYLFIQAKVVDRSQSKLVNRLRNLSGVSFGLMMASKYFPHYLGLNMLYHHNYSMRRTERRRSALEDAAEFLSVDGTRFRAGQPGDSFAKGVDLLECVFRRKVADAHRLFARRSSLQEQHFAFTILGHAAYFYLLWLAIKVPSRVLVLL
jgi:hypothetical protein